MLGPGYDPSEYSYATIWVRRGFANSGEKDFIRPPSRGGDFWGFPEGKKRLKLAISRTLLWRVGTRKSPSVHWVTTQANLDSGRVSEKIDKTQIMGGGQ